MDAASHVRCAAVIIWVAAITKCSSLWSLMFGWNQAPTDYQAVVNVATQLETSSQKCLGGEAILWGQRQKGIDVSKLAVAKTSSIGFRN